MNFPIRLLAAGLIGLSPAASAQTTVGVDPSQNWLGYMNVSNLPADGGGFVFGSGWGTADLKATFSGGSLTLSPNTIGDANPFWYIGGGAPGSPGNKIMEASMYVEKTGTLSGQTVTFSGNVVSNSFTTAHQSVIFIKDFAPDYSSFNTVSIPLVPGPFSISLNTIPAAGRHVQYGFTTTGVNVWETDTAPFGNAVIAVVAPPFNPVVTIDSLAAWQGYRNVFNLPEPESDGAYRADLSGALPVASLRAQFTGNTVTFSPTTVVTENGLDDDEWYLGDGTGAKTNECNLYVQFPPGAAAGKTIVFSGQITANTLTPAHRVNAFIREFSADFSQVLQETVAPLTTGGFSISLATGADPSHPVQYGLQMVGPNVWPDDAPGLGSIQIAAAEPPANPFASWIAGYDFSAFTNPDLSPAGDADGDGASNLEEFALDGNPANPGNRGKLQAGLATLGGESAFVLTLAVRGTPEFTGNPAKSATADGVSYLIEGTNTLANFDQQVAEVVPPVTTGLPAATPGWSYRSFRLGGSVGGPQSRGPSGFLRASLSPNP